VTLGNGHKAVSELTPSTGPSTYGLQQVCVILRSFLRLGVMPCGPLTSRALASRCRCNP